MFRFLHIRKGTARLDNAYYEEQYQYFKGSSFAIRRIADHLCIENGLSIVANPQPSKGTIYAKNKDGIKPPTGREQLRKLIDENLVIGNSLTEFITKLKRAGVEIKYGDQLTFKPPGSKRFFRQDSLGDDYSREAILERLAGRRTVAPPLFVTFKITGKTKFSLLIDIQKKIQEGKGEAYENWAKIYNLKQIAKTLCYLADKGIDSYDDLCKKSSAASGSFNQKLTRIKEIETRQNKITELQKHIGTYGKTREIYKQYRELPPKKRTAFYDAHHGDIDMHRAAKNHFDSLGYGKDKKLPSMDSLKQEWAKLDAEKKTLYRDYHQLKDERTDLVNARDNVERFLGLGQHTPERVTARAQKRNKSHAR